MTVRDLITASTSDICIMKNQDIVIRINYVYSLNAYLYFSADLLDSTVSRIDSTSGVLKVWLDKEVSDD